jgi:phosphate transport system substrate-binding protein
VIRRTLLLILCVLVPFTVFGQTTLNGAGATFPNPMYSKWFSEYHKVHPDVQVNYQPIGSGGGIRQVIAGTVDFGASDMPMTDDQLHEVKVKTLNIPTVLGAVVPAYNVPGVTGEVKFTPAALAGIFLGTISNWNDKAIGSANPGVNFPNQDIIVVHRSDGSGTSFIWTDFLSKVSPEWKNQVELIYAVQNNIAYGSVKNSAGNFVKASLEGVTAAAASSPKMPADFRVSITNAPGKDSYPISSFTWLLVPVQSKDAAKGKILADFLNWMVDDGQKMTAALAYAPLPDNVVQKVKETIKQVK